MTTLDVPLQDAQMREILAILAKATRVDGVEPIAEAGMIRLTRGSTDCEHRVITNEHGSIVAYGQIHPETSSAELVVDPDARRRGVGSHLVTTITDDVPGVRLWAHGDLLAAQRTAASLGLERVRTLLFLARNLSGTASASVEEPAGVQTRTMNDTEHDIDELLRVNAAAFVDHPEQGALSKEELSTLMSMPWFDLDRVLVVTDSQDRWLAFLWTKLIGTDGEIYVLGVDPPQQGRGLGGFLTHKSLDVLESLGARRVTLYVEGDNTAALKTYDRSGFTEVSRDVQYAKTA